MHTLEQLQEKIESAVTDLINQWDHCIPSELYQPISYSLSAGGKRIRPVLALLGCQLFDDNVDKVIPAALAIEIFHNFTLLHDDIIDNADMRRNQPTVHKKFSENRAILSGDAMVFLAYGLLMKSSATNPEIVSLLTQTWLEVCEGQQYDINFENRMDVTSREYLKMIKLKTAVLLGCALAVGAMAGGANVHTATMLNELGINVGLAFQLKDDFLDTFGDEKKFGKKIGNDIIANKKTYLLIKALENATPRQKEILQYWLNAEQFKPLEKIEAVTALYNETGAREEAEKLILSYTDSTLRLLEELPTETAKKAPLEKLCRQLMYRES